MGIKKYDLLEKSVKIDIHLDRPWGEPDEDYTQEIKYEAIQALPLFRGVPPNNPNGAREQYWEERIHIPSIKHHLIFVFESYAENCMGPNAESVQGIYKRYSG